MKSLLDYIMQRKLVRSCLLVGGFRAFSASTLAGSRCIPSEPISPPQNLISFFPNSHFSGFDVMPAVRWLPSLDVAHCRVLSLLKPQLSSHHDMEYVQI